MIVFDMDGTLADCEWRVHWVRQSPPNWDQFFAGAIDDKPIKPTLEVYKGLLSSFYVEIWTGRPERCREMTVNWFKRYGYGPGYQNATERLRMRPDDSRITDVELKEGWLEEVRLEGNQVDAVFEDRKPVVDMWRENGVICYHVGGGDF